MRGNKASNNVVVRHRYARRVLARRRMRVPQTGVQSTMSEPLQTNMATATAQYAEPGYACANKRAARLVAFLYGVPDARTRGVHQGGVKAGKPPSAARPRTCSRCLMGQRGAEANVRGKEGVV